MITLFNRVNVKWNNQPYYYLSLWPPMLKYFWPSYTSRWAWLLWHLSKLRHGSAQAWRIQVFW